MKKFCVFALLGIFAGLGAKEAAFTPGSVVYDGIIAKINGDIITKRDLDERVRLVVLSMGREIPEEMKYQIRQDVLHEMCNEILQNQLARKFVMFTPHKRWVEPEELNNAISSIAKRNNMTVEQFYALLKKNNISEKCFKNQIASSITWINFIRLKYGNSVQVSDRELKQLRAEYNKHKNETVYFVQRIILPVANKQDDANGLSQVKHINDLLERGVPFEELARQFSKGVEAQKGGNLGWIFADQLSQEESIVIKKIEIGGTAVVKTNHGYVILKLKTKRINNADYLTKIKFAQIALPLNQGYPREQVEAYLNELKRQYPTASSLVKGAQGKAYVSNIETVIADEVNPEFLKILNRLKPGDISKNYVINGALVVVCLIERIQEKVAQVTDDDLKNQKIEEKLNKLSDRERRHQKQISNIIMVK